MTTSLYTTLLAVFTAFAIGCSLSPSASELALFCKWSGIGLPSSAKPLSFRNRTFQDPMLWLQVEISKNEAENWLNSPQFRNMTMRTNNPFGLGMFEGFYRKRPSRFRSGSLQCSSNTFLEVLIDDGRAPNALVYFFFTGT